MILSTQLSNVTFDVYNAKGSDVKVDVKTFVAVSSPYDIISVVLPVAQVKKL